ncbi:MAG: phage integrase SAM-like domain-containing protein [Alistipes sp.]|nr:phage integrase SAM-like domain-containing protein [Alistipes sp.]
MKSTFRILFYAKRELLDEAKMVPIYVRVTINGSKVRFSLKIRVSEKIWDAKSGRAVGHSQEALQVNRYLDSVVTRINTIYYRLCEQSEAVTAQMVRDEFLGVKAPTATLLSVFAEFNDRQENLIGVDITQSTFNKFDLTYRRLEEFLRTKRNRTDIPITLVDRNFVLDFEAYLKVDFRLQANSAEKLMRIFKRITTMCFKSGLMAREPFLMVETLP